LSAVHKLRRSKSYRMQNALLGNSACGESPVIFYSQKNKNKMDPFFLGGRRGRINFFCFMFYKFKVDVLIVYFHLFIVKQLITTKLMSNCQVTQLQVNRGVQHLLTKIRKCKHGGIGPADAIVMFFCYL
jgi:hypothetical protein